MRKDISNWRVTHSEERGVNAKEWLEDPDTKKEALYKETQIKDDGESTHADYAESIVSDICNLLGIPCAQIDLVEKNGKEGCVSYNFCEENDELIEIGSVIQNSRLNFNTKSMIDNNTKKCYCIEMILEGLKSISNSQTHYAKMRKALLKDILVDSLVDHYDRNPSNLSIIQNRDGVGLSPKYDNGTALSVSLPEKALEGYIQKYPNELERYKALRDSVLTKIGYLWQKYKKYPELETFIFNYYYDDVKDFIPIMEEKLSDENIEKILRQDKYKDLSDTYKIIISGKLRTNRDEMLKRFRTISKKKEIDKIIYNKAAHQNFISHTKKGTIQKILPEYVECIGTKDPDSDYDTELDVETSEKIQSIVDISQLANFFKIPIDGPTPREKNLLKWSIIFENIQKANNENSFLNITSRLGFLSEDVTLIDSLISDKFKDPEDIFEARKIIYDKQNGITEENINIYLAKKFVDATVMRKGIREQRLEELATFANTIRECVLIENQIRSKDFPVKNRFFEKKGIDDKDTILKIKYALAREHIRNPRITKEKIIEIATKLALSEIGDSKIEIKKGTFVDKRIVDDINSHTHVLANGKKLVLYDKSTKFSNLAMKMGADYYGQICQHYSGDGVTLSIITKKGEKLPKSIKKYAEEIIKKYNKKDTPKGCFVLREAKGENDTSSFSVSSIKSSGARIPGVTVEEMTEKILEMFNEKSTDNRRAERTHIDD